MIKDRDYSGESLINIALRFLRSVSRRIRGFLYSRLNFFNNTNVLYFDRGARFFNSKQISFGQNNAFGINARVEVHNNCSSKKVKITIGDNSSFGDNCHIGALAKVSIGSYVLVGSNVLIIDHNHGDSKLELSKDILVKPRFRELKAKEVVIEDDVWIGDGVIVLPGSWIKQGAVIAANSVVRGVVSSREIYFGSEKGGR